MELEIMKKKLVPKGTIAMWHPPSPLRSEDAAKLIPQGWYLCDGTNGTPDLRERFIMGAAADRDPMPLTSGEPDRHSHSLPVTPLDVNTTEAGEHTHGFPSSWYHRSLAGNDFLIQNHPMPVVNRAVFNGIDTAHETLDTHPQVRPNGLHSHSVHIDLPQMTTSEYVGGNRPKWFALCFIMKA